MITFYEKTNLALKIYDLKHNIENLISWELDVHNFSNWIYFVY